MDASAQVYKSQFGLFMPRHFRKSVFIKVRDVKRLQQIY